MKNYKDFGKTYIGGSDIASLILVGCVGEDGELKFFDLHFGGDGDYRAYIVDRETAIPEHYNKVAEFTDWMRIYDDTSLVAKYDARLIEVFRAGDYGCIIKIDADEITNYAREREREQERIYSLCASKLRNIFCMKDYELKELTAIIKEIRENYTNCDMKGELDTYLANQLYEKGYRKDDVNVYRK